MGDIKEFAFMGKIMRKEVSKFIGVAYQCSILITHKYMYYVFIILHNISLIAASLAKNVETVLL